MTMPMTLTTTSQPQCRATMMTMLLLTVGTSKSYDRMHAHYEATITTSTGDNPALALQP